MHISIIGLIVTLALTLNCSYKIISSKAGDISTGTYEYYRALYYDKDVESEEIIEDLIDLETHGALADRFSLRHHARYKKFLQRNHRGRIRKATAWYGARYLSDRFTYQDLFQAFGYALKLKSAIRKIIKNRDLRYGKKELLISTKEIIVAKIHNEEISLYQLEKELNDTEKEQLLTSNYIMGVGYLKEALETYIAVQINRIVEEQFKANTTELQRIDHDKVAQLYLRKKYFQAFKGIYPTTPLRLKTNAQEIYYYFYKYRYKYMTLRSFQARMCRLKDDKNSEVFISAYKSGISFLKLTKKYCIKKIYSKYANWQPFKVSNIRLDIESLSEKKKLESVAMSLARTHELEPVIQYYKAKAYIVQVGKLKYQRIVKLEDVRDAVIEDYKKDLFQKQYHQDLTDEKSVLVFKKNKPISEINKSLSN